MLAVRDRAVAARGDRGLLVGAHEFNAASSSSAQEQRPIGVTMPTAMAYRDDREALEGQKAELEAKLSSLRTKLAENKDIEATMLATVRELEETYLKLNTAKTRAGERAPQRSLPLLQRVYIASPCAVPWESMSGDERARLCASCNKTVYDVSQMTTAEAEALLQSKGTDACLRIFRRFDGTVLTADCPVGVAKKKRARRRNVVAGVLAATAAATAAVAIAMRERSEDGAVEQRVEPSIPHGHTLTPPQVNPPVPIDGVQLPPGGAMFEPAVTPQPPRTITPQPIRGRTTRQSRRAPSVVPFK